MNNQSEKTVRVGRESLSLEQKRTVSLPFLVVWFTASWESPKALK